MIVADASLTGSPPPTSSATAAAVEAASLIRPLPEAVSTVPDAQTAVALSTRASPPSTNMYCTGRGALHYYYHHLGKENTAYKHYRKQFNCFRTKIPPYQRPNADMTGLPFHKIATSDL
jgi:hypothetical protein